MAVASAPAGRAIRLGHREYPVLLPKLSDPRLHLASVIISLQVLGQTVLHFELSIAQILVSLATCAIIEFSLTFWQLGVIAWPASALLTGNGVAFILRVNGTEHGDWWSMNGAYLFAATAALSLLSKYAIRVGGRPLFNPSNLGLVLCFVVVGTRYVNPLDFWWGPISPGLIVAYAIILVGGFLIGRRQRMLGMSVAFYVTFVAGIGVLSASGHCMTARWHVGAVCDGLFFRILVTSPEVLVFLFFMITDPKTTPAGRTARIAYGIGVGVFATLLIAPQRTEFATKVALLAGLVTICALRPLLERVLPASGSDKDRVTAWLGSARARKGGALLLGGVGVISVVTFAGLLLVLGEPSRLPPASVVAAGTRPPVQVEEGSVPKVDVDPAVSGIVSTIDHATAQLIGRDVVENLIIEGDALESGDADLAATALAGERLSAVREQIASAKGGDPIRAPVYDLKTMRLVVIRQTGNPQASPQLGMEITGTVTRGNASPTRVDETLVLAPAGAHYLLASRDPQS